MNALAPAPSSTDTSFNTPKGALILVVEDDRAIRETLKQTLELEGFEVITAEHGSEALEVLLEGRVKPSLILLDLMMPVMNGWEFLEALESSTALPAEIAQVPIVIASAVRERFTHNRAKDFLKKPIELDELLNVINRRIARAS
jgi:CheY-like chemotaxis protein